MNGLYTVYPELSTLWKILIYSSNLSRYYAYTWSDVSVAQWIAFNPHSARVPGLILSLVYSQCGVSVHVRWYIG